MDDIMYTTITMTYKTLQNITKQIRALKYILTFKSALFKFVGAKAQLEYMYNLPV